MYIPYLVSDIDITQLFFSKSHATYTDRWVQDHIIILHIVHAM